MKHLWLFPTSVTTSAARDAWRHTWAAEQQDRLYILLYIVCIVCTLLYVCSVQCVVVCAVYRKAVVQWKGSCVALACQLTPVQHTCLALESAGRRIHVCSSVNKLAV